MSRLAVALVAGVALVACAPPPIRVGPVATRAPVVSTADLLSTIDGSASQTYRVSYDLSGAGSGEAVRGRWVVYQRPPDARVDMSTIVGTQLTEQRTYAVGATVTICVAAECRSGPREGGSLLSVSAPLEAQLRARPGDHEVRRAEDREILGRTGSCFAVAAKHGVRAELREADLCYSADGIPLLLRTRTAEAELTFRAVAIASHVSDAELDPPRR